jgi:hypothetical protein
MNTEILAEKIGAGAAAGTDWTALIQGLMAASQKWAPQSLPPIKQDPGEFMVEKAEEQLPAGLREKIPEPLEKAAAKSLAFGYGTTFGALYATSRPETKSLLWEGSALGLAAWGVGYLGWLPASGLMPPGRQARAQANRRAYPQSYPIWNRDRRTLSCLSTTVLRPKNFPCFSFI